MWREVRQKTWAPSGEERKTFKQFRRFSRWRHWERVRMRRESLIARKKCDGKVSAPMKIEPWFWLHTCIWSVRSRKWLSLKGFFLTLITGVFSQALIISQATGFSKMSNSNLVLIGILPNAYVARSGSRVFGTAAMLVKFGGFIRRNWFVRLISAHQPWCMVVAWNWEAQTRPNHPMQPTICPGENTLT